MKTKLFFLAIIFLSPIGQAQSSTHETPTSQSVMTKPTLTDAQIVQVVTTANNAEIAAGQLAVGKSNDQSVKLFADKMITDHKQNNLDGVDMAKKAQIKPENSSVNKVLQKESRRHFADLKRVKRANFDREYMNSQVVMHKNLLADLDDRFIPAAQDPLLKAFLQAKRETVQAHLTRAQEIQVNLSK